MFPLSLPHSWSWHRHNHDDHSLYWCNSTPPGPCATSSPHNENIQSWQAETWKNIDAVFSLGDHGKSLSKVSHLQSDHSRHKLDCWTQSKQNFRFIEKFDKKIFFFLYPKRFFYFTKCRTEHFPCLVEGVLLVKDQLILDALYTINNGLMTPHNITYPGKGTLFKYDIFNCQAKVQVKVQIQSQV